MTKKILVCFFLVNCFLCGCTENTKVNIEKKNTLFSNGMHVEVIKSTTVKSTKGFFTGHNYGTSRTFGYSFSVDNGIVNWDGGSSEPKHLLFCKDSTFVHYVKKSSIQTTVKDRDSLGNPIRYNYKDTIQNGYEVYVDKRYFFRLFGDDFWSEIPANHYRLRKALCDEFIVPNDHELKMYNNSTKK